MKNQIVKISHGTELLQAELNKVIKGVLHVGSQSIGFMVIPTHEELLKCMPQRVGTHNGYVEHLGPEADYNDLPYEVHGGLTFIGKASRLRIPEPFKDEQMYIGFDTCHLDDGPHCDFDYVMSEIRRLGEQVVFRELRLGIRKSSFEKEQQNDNENDT